MLLGFFVAVYFDAFIKSQSGASASSSAAASAGANLAASMIAATPAAIYAAFNQLSAVQQTEVQYSAYSLTAMNSVCKISTQYHAYQKTFRFCVMSKLSASACRSPVQVEIFYSCHWPTIYILHAFSLPLQLHRAGCRESQEDYLAGG
jgi:hypothetical protein